MSQELTGIPKLYAYFPTTFKISVLFATYVSPLQQRNNSCHIGSLVETKIRVMHMNGRLQNIRSTGRQADVRCVGRQAVWKLSDMEHII